MSEPARWKSTCRVRRASGYSRATSGTNSPALRYPRRSSSKRKPSAQITGPASRRAVRSPLGTSGVDSVMYRSSVVKGRVVPRESRQSDVDSSTRRQPRPRVVAASLAMSAGMIGRHRPSISRGSALHDDAGDLLTPRSSALTPPSQAGGPSGDVGFELSGHSGEDRVGLAPTSRFCIVVASVAADHEAVPRDFVDDAR